MTKAVADMLRRIVFEGWGGVSLTHRDPSKRVFYTYSQLRGDMTLAERVAGFLADGRAHYDRGGPISAE